MSLSPSVRHRLEATLVSGCVPRPLAGPVLSLAERGSAARQSKVWLHHVAPGLLAVDTGEGKPFGTYRRTPPATITLEAFLRGTPLPPPASTPSTEENER